MVIKIALTNMDFHLWRIWIASKYWQWIRCWVRRIGVSVRPGEAFLISHSSDCIHKRYLHNRNLQTNLHFSGNIQRSFMWAYWPSYIRLAWLCVPSLSKPWSMKWLYANVGNAYEIVTQDHESKPPLRIFGRWWGNNVKLYLLEDVRNGVCRVQLTEVGVYVWLCTNTVIATKI
jgi:hypothetical protein